MLLAPSGNALAQSWLPWTTREEPRRQPEPQRQPSYDQYRQPQQNNVPAYGRPGYSGNDRSPICLQLEQRLAEDANRHRNSGGTIQRLRSDLAQARNQQRRADRELDQRDCYETFLFSKSLRPSRTCRQLDQPSETNPTKPTSAINSWRPNSRSPRRILQ